jgi:hypothetical protein
MWARWSPSARNPCHRLATGSAGKAVHRSCKLAIYRLILLYSFLLVVEDPMDFMKCAAKMCIVALFIGACGGSETGQPVIEEVDTPQQSYLWDCRSNEAWLRRWYNSSGTMTGHDTCCYGTLTSYGSWSARYTQQGLSSCSGGDQ